MQAGNGYVRFSFPFRSANVRKMVGTAGFEPRDSLTPQDGGLGILAGQTGSNGGAIRVPTCRLSDWTHVVWSPAVPRKLTACMPYPANLSSAGAALARSAGSHWGPGSLVSATGVSG